MANRARRSGQIIARGEGKWLVRLFLGRDADGKKHYFSKTVRGTKKAAESFLGKLQIRQQLGESLQQTEMTLDAFINQWLDVVKLRAREGTHRHYAQMMNTYVRPELGGRRLADILGSNIQRVYAKMQDAKLSSTTIRSVHMMLANLFDLAIKRDLIRKNPMLAVEPPARKQREMMAMSADQIRAFLGAAEARGTGALFGLAFFTGARPCEYLGLKWSDLDGNQLSIRRSILWRPKTCEYYFEEPKTAKGKRTITLSEKVLRQLAEHRTRQLEQRLKAGRLWQGEDFIFSDAYGLPLHRERVRETFKEILAAAGLPGSIRLYDTRHSCATALMAAGVHVKVVSERLGHAAASITLDIYSHVLPGQQEEASTRLEKAIWG